MQIHDAKGDVCPRVGTKLSLRPYQLEALAEIERRQGEGKRVLVVSPTGCHREGQNILRANGRRARVEDVEVGDTLLGPDFQTRTIQRLCRGFGAMARIISAGRAPFVVNLDHILTLCAATPAHGEVDVRDVTVRAFMRWSRQERERWSLFRVATDGAGLYRGDDLAIERCMPFGVEVLGKEPFFGFTLDGDGRYLLDDFTVTHNSGKTVLAAEFIARALAREQRVLFVAHRREIINQTYDKLHVAGLAANQVGIVMAGDARRRSCAPVQVASIDTLRCRSKPWADIVIVDEAHRAMAKSYRDLAAAYPRAFHVGLTATPDRADGQGLADAYDDLVVVTTPAALMKAGFLVQPRCFTVPKERGPDLSAVRMKGGDFDERALAGVMNRTELVGDIVDHWKKRAERRRTVAFAVDIAHSMQIADRFNKAGIRAEHLDGSTSKEERDAILARLERGETLIVSNCNVLVEGWDQPAVKCAILARPTASSTMYLQQAGRILRPWTDPTTGETPTAILLDHAACIAMHGLPQDERDYQLAAPKKRGRPSLGPTRECPACSCVIPLGARECPACHEEIPFSEPGGVVETAGELVEVVPEDPALRAEKIAEWRRLLEVQRVCSCKRGWAQHKYREKYNEAPPRVASNAETPEAKAAFLDEMRSMCTRRGYDAAFAATRYRERFREAPPAGWDAPLAEAANDNAELSLRASGDWFF